MCIALCFGSIKIVDYSQTLSVTTTMTTIIYIIVFGLIAYVVIGIIANSSRTKYSPNDKESITRIDSTKRNLREKWNIDPGNFWIPLNGDVSDNSCYFNTDEFNSHFGLDKLSGLINRIEKGKIYSCLLYTSPSPRDMRRSRMPSSA